MSHLPFGLPAGVTPRSGGASTPAKHTIAIGWFEANLRFVLPNLFRNFQPGAGPSFRTDCISGMYHANDWSSRMGMLKVQVWDATGNKRQDVELPDDAPVNRILAVLLERMKFPQYAPDGQPLSYKFHHRASGKQLLDTQCLVDVGAKEGDVLRLQPEITAG